MVRATWVGAAGEAGQTQHGRTGRVPTSRQSTHDRGSKAELESNTRHRAWAPPSQAPPQSSKLRTGPCAAQPAPRTPCQGTAPAEAAGPPTALLVAQVPTRTSSAPTEQGQRPALCTPQQTSTSPRLEALALPTAGEGSPKAAPGDPRVPLRCQGWDGEGEQPVPGALAALQGDGSKTGLIRAPGRSRGATHLLEQQGTAAHSRAPRPNTAWPPGEPQ